MMVSGTLRSWFVAGTALALGAAAGGGCATVGPKSIEAGRLKYAEAINRTADEQLLLAIVKGRYGESSSLLTVNGVAANLRFRAELGAEVGIPGGGDAGDNLAIGGFAYEENPTITYTPVQGDQYLRELLSPIPLDILVMSLRSVATNSRLFELLVSRVNHLRNPSFQREESPAPDPEFLRFIALLRALGRANVLEVVSHPETGADFNLLISDYAPDHRDEVAEFLSLLDIVPPAVLEDDLVIPISQSVVPKDTWAIGITTRSTFDLLEILKAEVAVPAEHAGKGITLDYPAPGLPGQGVVIHSSTDRPCARCPAVEYRDHWFYISEDDQVTKAVFAILRASWSLCIDKSLEDVKTPVLTIPVGG